ncbi:hypothetical protein C1H46_023094 [Malus baccata]|uniref:Protein mago nashi homolog n=1 Tax=Malus baccata TaxID=106549 RepID=A0A540LXW5_MALBA|nr:hypothetical protein C1H46_023094 [Malus baccata]
MKEERKKQARETEIAGGEETNEFYLRYYVGHKGKFGHEFLEFEFRPDGVDPIHQQFQLQERHHHSQGGLQYGSKLVDLEVKDEPSYQERKHIF